MRNPCVAGTMQPTGVEACCAPVITTGAGPSALDAAIKGLEEGQAASGHTQQECDREVSAHISAATGSSVEAPADYVAEGAKESGCQNYRWFYRQQHGGMWAPFSLSESAQI